MNMIRWLLFAATAAGFGPSAGVPSLVATHTMGATRLIPDVHNWFVDSGTPMYYKAAFYGFWSTVSLPIGAALGLALHPINPQKCALIVAFGAGALIFAVSTELYAEALRQVEEDASTFALKEIGLSMSCAVVGAVAFTLMNIELENWSAKQTAEKRVKRDAEQEEARMALSEEDRANMDLQISFRLAGAKDVEAHPEESNVAMAMWLGVALDGIPEAILLAFITNERAMTISFIVSIFVANFPEAFSSASMLRAKGMDMKHIFGMWCSLCVVTTFLAGFASYLLPVDMHKEKHGFGGPHDNIVLAGAAIEGLAGGAMMAMVCATMLPEAFSHGGRWSGVSAVLGFLMSCTIKVYFGRASSGDTVAAEAVITKEMADQAAKDAVGVIAPVAFLHFMPLKLH